MEEFLSSWGLPVEFGTSANCSVANLYTVISIDAAADLTIGVWVEAVATVGVGSKVGQDSLVGRAADHHATGPGFNTCS